MNMDLIRNAVAEAARQFGAEEYELTITDKENTGVEALKKEISSVSYARSGSMMVRCVVGGKSGYAASELLTPEAAAQIVETACDNALVLDDADQVGLFPGSDRYETSRDRCIELPDADSLKDRALRLLELAYAADEKVIDGTQSFVSGMNIRQDVMNSAGLQLHYETGLVFQGLSAAVKDGEEAADDFCLTDIRKKTVEQTVQEAVTGALGKLGADTVPSGRYNIIMSSSAVQSLLKIYAPIFSARSAHLKTTLLAGKEGEIVASENVTLIDDPFYPEKFGHCPFDGQGDHRQRRRRHPHRAQGPLLRPRHPDQRGTAAAAGRRPVPDGPAGSPRRRQRPVRRLLPPGRRLPGKGRRQDGTREEFHRGRQLLPAAEKGGRPVLRGQIQRRQ